MAITEKYLEKQTATFAELKKHILNQKAKSEYKQAAIIMMRLAFTELMLYDINQQRKLLIDF